MRSVAALSVCVGVVMALACGGAGVETAAPEWDVAQVEPAPSPSEALQPAVIADVPDAADAPEPATEPSVDAPVTANGAATTDDPATTDTPATTDAPAGADDEEVVNKPVDSETPADEPTAVGVGQIQLITGAGIQPMVDGVPMRLTTSQGFLAEVSAGKHSLEIRNLLGNVTGSAEVDVLDGRRTRFEWRRRSLSLLGDVEASAMPSGVDWDEVFGNNDDAGTTTDDKQPVQPAPVVDKK